ncbi:MAG TPA: acyl-CoA dehydrogenase family protein [Xanthobacteraceae bacterium]
MSESADIIAATAARIFRDFADPHHVNSSADEARKPRLWQALTQAGLTLAWVPEEQGGAGASLAEGFVIIRAAGRYAAPIPIAETLLAGWLLSQAKIASPDGEMALAPMHPADRIMLNPDGTLSGSARGVSFAQEARHIAVCVHGGSARCVALVDAAACAIPGSRSIAGEPRSTMIFDRARPVCIAAAGDFDPASVMLMGAAVRSVESAGALESVLGLSLAYANERIAFGRPIGKFQVVQHNLARLAGEVAAAMTAAGSAADALSGTGACDDAVFLEVASAKIRCAEAAQEGAAIAHQIHGAMGFTREHVLHRYTLRLLSWRDDFGNESHWAAMLGNRIAAGGAEALWPLLASR